MFNKFVFLLGQFVKLYTSHTINSKIRNINLGEIESSFFNILKPLKAFWTTSLQFNRWLDGKEAAPSFSINIKSSFLK